MLLWTRVSLGTLFAATAVAATALAWHQHRAATHAPVVAAAEPQVIEPQAAVAQAPVPDQAPTDDTALADDEGLAAEGSDPPRATAGDANDAWLPRGYVRTLSTTDASDLVAFADAWLRGDGVAPAIEYRKGVVFVESREDRGDDGPLPRSAEPEGERVCGTRATWMRQALAQTLENTSLTCAQNVCWYGGMEYAPSGYLVFHRYKTTDDQDTWALDAWIQVFDAGLPPKTAQHNEEDVLEMLAKLPRSCAGEPAGAY